MLSPLLYPYYLTVVLISPSPSISSTPKDSLDRHNTHYLFIPSLWLSVLSFKLHHTSFLTVFTIPHSGNPFTHRHTVISLFLPLSFLPSKTLTFSSLFPVSALILSPSLLSFPHACHSNTSCYKTSFLFSQLSSPNLSLHKVHLIFFPFPFFLIISVLIPVSPHNRY